MMPVADLLALDTPDADDLDVYDVAGVLDVKRASGHYPQLLDQIRDRGVTVPVLVVDGWLRDGHHRVAAAVDLGLSLMPVTDTEADTVLPGGFGWQITPGVIDEHAVRAFTLGACGGLAIALHDLTGWPLTAVTVNDGDVLHYLVRAPDGALVDVEGAHTDDDMRIVYWPEAHDEIVHLVEHDRDRVWAWYRDECGVPVGLGVAWSIAVVVLATLGMEADVLTTYTPTTTG